MRQSKVVLELPLYVFPLFFLLGLELSPRAFSLTSQLRFGCSLQLPLQELNLLLVGHVLLEQFVDLLGVLQRRSFQVLHRGELSLQRCHLPIKKGDLLLQLLLLQLQGVILPLVGQNETLCGLERVLPDLTLGFQVGEVLLLGDLLALLLTLELLQAGLDGRCGRDFLTHHYYFIARGGIPPGQKQRHRESEIKVDCNG